MTTDIRRVPATGADLHPGRESNAPEHRKPRQLEFERPPEHAAGFTDRNRGPKSLRNQPRQFWDDLGGLLKENGLRDASGGELKRFFEQDSSGRKFLEQWGVTANEAKFASRVLLKGGDRDYDPHRRGDNEHGRHGDNDHGREHGYGRNRTHHDRHGEINPEQTYRTPNWLVRQYGFPETIRGGDLLNAYAAFSQGGAEALQASMQTEFSGLGFNGQGGGGGDFGAFEGGLFDGLKGMWGLQGSQSAALEQGPVGYINGRPVYQTPHGQFVYASGASVPAEALSQAVGTNGQPISGSTSPVHGFAAATSSDPNSLVESLSTSIAGKLGSGSLAGGASNQDAAAAATAAQANASTGTAATGSVVADAKTAVLHAFRDPSQPIPGRPQQGKPESGPPTSPTTGLPTGSQIPTGDLGELPRDVVRTVQNILSELTGYTLSLGQTRQFMNRLSPSELSAFLANPAQKLPDVMSTLMHVVMRDHGRPDRVGRDAVLAMFDHLMLRKASAQEIHNFIKSLTRDQIEHLITYRAEMIGNLPGVPQEVRVAANLQRIEAELTVMQSTREPGAELRAQTLERLLTQNAQILHFDNAPDGRIAAGRISQVFGNLAEAKHVGLMIPGLNNTMDNFSARAQRGQLLHQLATPMARDGVAIVVWLERLGQEVLKQYKSMLTAWQAREQQTRAPMTFQQALAQAARQLAQETVPGMMLRGDARLTFVGHSFGSLIAKESLNQGAKPDACVFLGMPEHRLKKIGAQAGCGDVDLYSLVADGDTVDEAMAADEAPEAVAADTAGMDEEFDRLDPGKDLVPPIEACLDPHDNYGLEGSASLAQIVGVTLGWRAKLLPSEPSVITLYRSADGTFEDQTEPVGWFGPQGEDW